MMLYMGRCFPMFTSLSVSTEQTSLIICVINNGHNNVFLSHNREHISTVITHQSSYTTSIRRIMFGFTAFGRRPVRYASACEV